MQRKIFIAIEIPKPVKKRLVQKTEKWRDLPVRWTREENLHVTLAFLGYIDDSALPEICSAARDIARNFKSFDLHISRIAIGPDEKHPRMIWAAGEPSEELKNLKEQIEKKLEIFQRERKEVRAHVTIGRIRQKKWKGLPEIPAIDEKVNFIVPLESIEVLESVIEGGKRKYLLLENCPLA